MTTNETKPAAPPATVHTCDADCASHIDPETDCCAACGVDHGGPECAWCGCRGFHAVGCESPENDEEIDA